MFSILGYKTKRGIASCFLLLSLGLGLATPQPAQGFIPVIESGPNLAVNTVTSGATNWLSLVKEMVLDGIVWAATQQIIAGMVRDLTDWVSGGFSGSPQFVQNPGNFLRGIGDRIAGQLIEDLGFGFLCEPFQLDIQFALDLRFDQTRIEDTIGCTLSDVITNVEDFTAFTTGGDFLRGGWDGWFSMTQNSRNNPYGSFLEAQSAVSFRISGAQEIALLDLEMGQGFLSFRDSSGNVQTPGSVINTQLNHALGTEMRQLELADEFNQLFGALVGQLLNTVFSGTGLIGATGSSPAMSSWASQESDPAMLDGVTPAISLDGTLTVFVDGGGRGSVSVLAVNPADPATAIEDSVCSTDNGSCSFDLPQDSEITLTAEAEPHVDDLYRFERWGGQCSGNDPVCTFTLSGSVSATAQFEGSEDDDPFAIENRVERFISTAHTLDIGESESNASFPGITGTLPGSGGTTLEDVLINFINFTNLTVEPRSSADTAGAQIMSLQNRTDLFTVNVGSSFFPDNRFAAEFEGVEIEGTFSFYDDDTGDLVQNVSGTVSDPVLAVQSDRRSIVSSVSGGTYQSLSSRADLSNATILNITVRDIVAQVPESNLAEDGSVESLLGAEIDEAVTTNLQNGPAIRFENATIRKDGSFPNRADFRRVQINQITTIQSFHLVGGEITTGGGQTFTVRHFDDLGMSQVRNTDISGTVTGGSLRLNDQGDDRWRLTSGNPTGEGRVGRTSNNNNRNLSGGTVLREN